MTDDTDTVLRKARKLIQIGWTKGANARNNRQVVVPWNSPYATCFCIYGAVRRSIQELGMSDMLDYPVMRRLHYAAPMGFNAIDVNDCAQSKRDVLDLIDRALEQGI